MFWQSVASTRRWVLRLPAHRRAQRSAVWCGTIFQPARQPFETVVVCPALPVSRSGGKIRSRILLRPVILKTSQCLSILHIGGSRKKIITEFKNFFCPIFIAVQRTSLSVKQRHKRVPSIFRPRTSHQQAARSSSLPLRLSGTTFLFRTPKLPHPGSIAQTIQEEHKMQAAIWNFKRLKHQKSLEQIPLDLSRFK